MKKKPETTTEILKKVIKRLSRLENKMKEVEKKIDYVYDDEVTEIPNNDKMNRPA